MSKVIRPRLRTVDKVVPPYRLNQFPSDFGYKVGREVIYLLATKAVASIEGPEWEQIFAKCIGAEWKPSTIGLDDVTLGAFTWGAKTLQNPHPATVKTVRLISGRNSIIYSFDELAGRGDPQRTGEQVLSIWNERVAEVRNRFHEARTVVLIKGPQLLNLCIFEFETIRFPHDEYRWQWNEKNNLEGYHIDSNIHKFTWQPHGAQFTIKEDIPEESLLISLTAPPIGDVDELLDRIGFEKSWVQVTRRNIPSHTH
jgi:hypothetical protein